MVKTKQTRSSGRTFDEGPAIEGQIRVGSDYQARVGDYKPTCSRFNLRDRSRRPSSVKRELLIWSPLLHASNDTDLDRFVECARRCNGLDEDQALAILLTCDGRFSDAYRELKQYSSDSGNCNQFACGLPANKGSIARCNWSQRYCSQFEDGLQTFGKDFVQIRQLMGEVKMSELVEHYYIWKRFRNWKSYVGSKHTTAGVKITLSVSRCDQCLQQYLPCSNPCDENVVPVFGFEGYCSNDDKAGGATNMCQTCVESPDNWNIQDVQTYNKFSKHIYVNREHWCQVLTTIKKRGHVATVEYDNRLKGEWISMMRMYQRNKQRIERMEKVVSMLGEVLCDTHRTCELAALATTNIVTCETVDLTKEADESHR